MWKVRRANLSELALQVSCTSVKGKKGQAKKYLNKKLETKRGKGCIYVGKI